jgi:hypothetical protein
VLVERERIGALRYDTKMFAKAVPPQSRTMEEVVLWIVIGLCLALGVAWETYPSIFMHVHHPPHGPESSYTWRNESFGPSPLMRSFFYACLIAGPGFAQLRFSQWFRRDTSKILLRVYLSAGLVMVVGMWTFDLANRFWTDDNPLEFLGAQRGMEIGTTLFRLGAWSGLGVALLNLGYGLVRRPGV